MDIIPLIMGITLLMYTDITAIMHPVLNISEAVPAVMVSDQDHPVGKFRITEIRVSGMKDNARIQIRLLNRGIMHPVRVTNHDTAHSLNSKLCLDSSQCQDRLPHTSSPDGHHLKAAYAQVVSTVDRQALLQDLQGVQADSEDKEFYK